MGGRGEECWNKDVQVVFDEEAAEEVDEEGGCGRRLAIFVEGFSLVRAVGEGGARTDAEAEEAEQRDRVRAEAPAEFALAGWRLLLHCGCVVVDGEWCWPSVRTQRV